MFDASGADEFRATVAAAEAANAGSRARFFVLVEPSPSGVLALAVAASGFACTQDGPALG